MIGCISCHEVLDDDCVECPECGCREFEFDLQRCVHCDCWTTEEDSDRNGLCGAEGNNCSEDPDIVDEVEDYTIGIILEASKRLL